MKIIKNTEVKLIDDIKNEIKKNSKLSIIASYFSIYAYEKLRKELKNIDSFNFIFNKPTFIMDDVDKKLREYYIPKQNREKAINGCEFELKLKNDFMQRYISSECAKWIKEKAKFKSVKSNQDISTFIHISNDDSQCAYFPFDKFTLQGLGVEKGNTLLNITCKHENLEAIGFKNEFSSINSKNDFIDVTNKVISSIEQAYKENEPEFLYFFSLYSIFNEFLKEVSEDELANERTGFKESIIWNKLYNFQKDAALSIINKLEKYNGCILADSVGLGKTFTALSVIKYYESRNKNVLVLCPKKLAENWNTYRSNYEDNPLIDDRFRYDVLFHTDLSRDCGVSNGINLERIHWGNYDLVIIDESHNFRNGGKITTKDDETIDNRYLKLINKVIKNGVKTKVLMLSATPVNNRFLDLKNQLAIAYENESNNIDKKLKTKNTIDEIFRIAQTVFTKWSKLPIDDRTTKNLLSLLDNDFFEVLDSVTIARSRKHIKEYYDTSEIGEFPNRLKPITIREKLSNLENGINYKDIYNLLNDLNLSVYAPSSYIYPTKLSKYEVDTKNIKRKNLTIGGREKGLVKLMSINLLKRLESSVNSFEITLSKINAYIESIIGMIDNYKENASILFKEIDTADLDYDDLSQDFLTVGKNIKIDLADIDRLTWKRELKKDVEILNLILSYIREITPKNDNKLQKLLGVLEDKINNPINDNNKKVIIFTSFADTACYLYENVATFIKEKYGLNTALISGNEIKTTINSKGLSMNSILTLFSPISKDRVGTMKNARENIDILIATDCISEGQNLQDCDYLINYDIHWNPVRIIQRFGRIDRLGSKNKDIQMVNFWPDMELDEYINLKERVESRMKISVLASTGDDNLLNDDEKGDLVYRKEQLKRLQEEVVDIEDMNQGISIVDLGLNEYKLDLLELSKKYYEPEKIPTGIYSLADGNDKIEKGVIFLLKNSNKDIKNSITNRVYPFYMVYIDNNGEIMIDYQDIKGVLDKYRVVCRGKDSVEEDLVELFNKETKDGSSMDKYSELLSLSVASMIDKKEENELDLFLNNNEDTSFVDYKIDGLDDFELVSFLVIR